LLAPSLKLWRDCGDWLQRRINNLTALQFETLLSEHSHFDAHQTDEEADRRSSAGHYQVDLAWKNDHLYARLWLLLKTLGRVAPAPVESRARMRAAIEARDS